MSESTPGPRITIRENGPYRVEGDVPLFDHLGNRIEPPKPGGYSLCRCGASATKPFCDKTHSAIGFVGARIAAEMLDREKKEG
jgi:CDGSH-type Zn-finger protein